MTVSTETIFTIGLGNGVTTVWPFSFIIPYQADGVTPAVQVSILDTTVTPQTITVLVPGQYSITGVGNDMGGTVIYTPALANGKNILIARALDYIQGTSILNQGFFPSTVEVVADNLEEQIQQLNSNTLRAIVIPIFDLPLDMTLPVAADRASKFAAYDNLGKPIAVDLAAIPVISTSTSLQIFLSQSGNPVTQAVLLAADAAAVALSAILVIDQNVTLSSNVTLLAKQVLFAGGIITRGTHTISGNFIFSNTRGFDIQGASSGLVSFPRVPLFFLPTMFGAANDGVTDDFYSIQAAISAAVNNGGQVIIRGSYLTTQQLFADTLSTQVINYTIDGYGGRIITSGAISGLQISCFNNTQGPRVQGLTIDQFNANATLATGGFDMYGAIGSVLKDCSVVVSDIALGANRANYYAYKMRARGAFGSYFATMEDCVNRVPDSTGAGHYIKAGLLVTDDCNNAKVIRFRTNEIESGIRIIAASTNSPPGAGQPNCFVVEDLAAEGFTNAALYILQSSNDALDTYLFGLKVDGIRSEPDNGGTFAFKVETTGAGAWANTSRVPRLANIEDIGGGRISVPGGMTYVEYDV